MPKRKDRIKPIQHEMRQIENLKELEPNATPPDNQALSDALIDIAVAALHEVEQLESGENVNLVRLGHLADLVAKLPTLVEV